MPTSNQSPIPVIFPSTVSPELESSSPYWFPRAAIANYHFGGLKTTDTYSFMDLKVRGLKSRCWQGWFFPETLREKSFPASRQASNGCQPSLWLQHSSSAYMVTWCFLCVPLGPNVPLLIKFHSNPVWPHLNLIISAKILLTNKVRYTGARG